MAANNQISIKKTSRVLAITCVAYTTEATILYNNYQIDLIDYSTPVILGTVATIMSCAALQRLFCSLLSKSCLSFGCKELSSRGTVPSETNPDTQEELPQTDDATSKKQAESPYLKEYEARIEELRRNEMEKKTAIVHAIHEYTTHEMSQFISIDDLETLHENIESLAYGQAEPYKPVRSKPDNQIKSPSLRHYAWNIGERLDIPLTDRAKFIKTIFPHELENATIEYLCKNLRDSVPAIIAIDVPENGDYHFSCMQTSADSDN